MEWDDGDKEVVTLAQVRRLRKMIQVRSSQRGPRLWHADRCPLLQLKSCTPPAAAEMEEVVDTDPPAEEEPLGLDDEPSVDDRDGAPSLPPILHTLRPHCHFHILAPPRVRTCTHTASEVP